MILWPDVHNTYNIGTDAKRWATGNFANVTTNTLTTNDPDFGNTTLLVNREIYIISPTQGDDTRAGEHPADPVRTIAKVQAMQERSIVYIYPDNIEAF